MRRLRYAVPILIAVLATATVVFGTSGRWEAALKGSEEVPPAGVEIETSGDGLARFRMNDEKTTLWFTLDVRKTARVTQAHIHQGARGSNGPIIADLAVWGNLDSKGPSIPSNGRIVQGYITSFNLKGPMAGKSLTDLKALLDNGGAYVNVHTLKYPSGEVRGQIRATDSGFRADEPTD